tara:strand:- start:513 stop:662 length:150 start_codon:yes stop_codon:yes gene_type:complete
MTVHSGQPVFLMRSLEDKAVDDEANDPTDHENRSGREYMAFGGLFSMVV